MSVTTQSDAERILKNRERYWEQVQEKEDWEAEFGPPIPRVEDDEF